MSLCLANSLVARRDFILYDQLVRYKWWYRDGYMSSTGDCFDIGAATKKSIQEFEQRQRDFSREHGVEFEQMDHLSDPNLLSKFDVNCSEDGVAGNGALMRLAPVPLFFHRDPEVAVEYAGLSAKITHGDDKAVDACRYYAALIVAAVRGESKDKLLDRSFYKDHEKWFGKKPLHPDILNIAAGSFKKHGGYDDGIRGKGYVVDSLQAALWAFWKHPDSFEEGALAAVNLGDDTDTTAAIYGQLAGAFHGYNKLPKDWKKELYAKSYIQCLCKWITFEGEQWHEKSERKTRERTDSNSNSRLGPNNAESETRRPRGRTVVEESANYNLEPHGNQSIVRSSSATRGSSNTPRARKLRKIRLTTKTCIISVLGIFIHPKMKSVQDVVYWLESMNKEHSVYRNSFMKHGVDTYWLLNHVTDAYLKEYGVENSSHRKDIIRGIEILKKQCPLKYADK